MTNTYNDTGLRGFEERETTCIDIILYVFIRLQSVFLSASAHLLQFYCIESPPSD